MTSKKPPPQSVKPKKRTLPPIRYLSKKPLPATRINWPKFYESQHQDPFATTESLQSFDTLKRFLFRVIHRESSVLIVGCGNSRLGEALYDSGVENITCTGRLLFCVRFGCT